MQLIVDDVAAFHRACDVPVLSGPQIPAAERVELRINILDEEVNKELIPAMRAGDLPKILEGIGDSIYVLVGTALEFGLPLSAAWQIIHAANMLKVDPATGKVRKREDGKVLKPEGWTAPDIEGLIQAYQNAGRAPGVRYLTPEEGGKLTEKNGWLGHLIDIGIVEGCMRAINLRWLSAAQAPARVARDGRPRKYAPGWYYQRSIDPSARLHGPFDTAASAISIATGAAGAAPDTKARA